MYIRSLNYIFRFHDINLQRTLKERKSFRKCIESFQDSSFLIIQQDLELKS